MPNSETDTLVYIHNNFLIDKYIKMKMQKIGITLSEQ